MEGRRYKSPDEVRDLPQQEHEEREVTKTEIGAVPKVKLQAFVPPPKSGYLYAGKYLASWGLHHGVSRLRFGTGRPDSWICPIHGAQQRLSEFEGEDRCFSRFLARAYQEGVERPLERLHQEADKTLDEISAGLEAMHMRVAAAAKNLGGRSGHRPPSMRYPTSRPRESEDIEYVSAKYPPCPTYADDCYSRPPVPAYRQDFSSPEERRQYNSQVSRIKNTLYLNAINRRLWKYQFRFSQYGLDLQAIRKRADDRLAYLDQRLGWAEALATELSELEKSLRPLQDIAKHVDPPIDAVESSSLFVSGKMLTPRRQAAESMPQFANDGLPTLDHLRSHYENRPPYHTSHYVFAETTDSDVPQSMINHVHSWLANLQNKQVGLWGDARKITESVAEKARGKERRIAEIRRKHALIYNQIDKTVKTLEAKAKLAPSRATPSVKDLILIHEAAIAAARPCA
jgi:hypothetical protein